MERKGDTIEFTIEEEVNIDTYVEVDAGIDINEVLEFITDEEIEEEYAKRYNNKERDFNRTICDLLEIGYYNYDTDQILEIIKQKL